MISVTEIHKILAPHAEVFYIQNVKKYHLFWPWQLPTIPTTLHWLTGFPPKRSYNICHHPSRGPIVATCNNTSSITSDHFVKGISESCKSRDVLCLASLQGHPAPGVAGDWAKRLRLLRKRKGRSGKNEVSRTREIIYFYVCLHLYSYPYLIFTLISIYTQRFVIFYLYESKCQKATICTTGCDSLSAPIRKPATFTKWQVDLGSQMTPIWGGKSCWQRMTFT